jgi:hypothetical protein
MHHTHHGLTNHCLAHNQGEDALVSSPFLLDIRPIAKEVRGVND